MFISSVISLIAMAICSSLNLSEIATGLRGQTAVLAAVEEQRFPFVAFHGFHFADKDGVIARRVFAYDVARQLRQRVVQQRNPTCCPPVANAQVGILFRCLLGFGEIFGERLLPFAKNTDTKAA